MKHFNKLSKKEIAQQKKNLYRIKVNLSEYILNKMEREYFSSEPFSIKLENLITIALDNIQQEMNNESNSSRSQKNS